MGGARPLPFGLTMKRKYESAQTKRLNWQKIEPVKLRESSVWTMANEQKFSDEALMSEIASVFATKAPKTARSDGPVAEKKRQKENKILDAKKAQNLSIFLGRIKVPYQSVRKQILQCSPELESSFVIGLLNQLPDAEQISMFKELKDEYNDLVEAEKFCVVVSDMHRVHMRLETIKFQREFEEIVDRSIKPDIVSVTEASRKISKSKSFRLFLELVLFIGNVMNAGGRNQQSFGFDIEYLPKLRDSKTADNSMTMLHFIAQLVETDPRYEEIRGFDKDLYAADRARRVAQDDLNKSINNLTKEVKNLEKNVEQVSKLANKDPDDKFDETMNEFLITATEQHKLCLDLKATLDQEYDNLADYLCFNTKKTPIEAFFSMMNQFREDYAAAVRENQMRKEEEEKKSRREMAKVAAEQAKIKKKQKLQSCASKTQIIDDESENVIDDMLKALQSGEGNKKRRRARRSGVPTDGGGDNRTRSRRGGRQVFASLEEAMAAP